jgi:hypothetical protein
MGFIFLMPWMDGSVSGRKLKTSEKTQNGGEKIGG